MSAKREDIEKHFKSCGLDVSMLPFDKALLRTPLPPAFASLPEPQTVIVAVFPYYFGDLKGNISKYAACRDYHIYVLDALKKACGELSKHYKDNYFLPFVDSSPIKEVYAAAAAGIGIIGMNGLLITPRFGSFVFIGEVLTDLKVEGIKALPVKYCEGCGKCIAACPGKALKSEHYAFDRSKCLSHITQKRGELDAEDLNRIIESKTVWGCDVCQDVCPHNRGIPKTRIPWFNENLIASLSLADIEGLDNEAFKSKYKDRAFTWRGVGVLLRNLRARERDNNKSNP